eukprot:6184675-Pleurochrysis_carterae.AAC.1
MDVEDCVTGQVDFKIAVSLYTGFVHGLYSCTLGLYTASIFVYCDWLHAKDGPHKEYIASCTAKCGSSGMRIGTDSDSA